MPDDLFKTAKATARRLRVSRGELYTKAISEFFEQRGARTITDRLNDVYSKYTSKLDRGRHRAQLKSIEKDAC